MIIQNRISTKLFFVGLIFISLACEQFMPTPEIPSPSVETTEPPNTDTNLTESPAATEAVAIIFGEIARQHIAAITEQFGARWTGTEAERQTAQYIEE